MKIQLSLVKCKVSNAPLRFESHGTRVTTSLNEGEPQVWCFSTWKVFLLLLFSFSLLFALKWVGKGDVRAIHFPAHACLSCLYHLVASLYPSYLFLGDAIRSCHCSSHYSFLRFLYTLSNSFFFLSLALDTYFSTLFAILVRFFVYENALYLELTRINSFLHRFHLCYLCFFVFWTIISAHHARTIKWEITTRREITLICLSYYI